MLYKYCRRWFWIGFCAVFSASAALAGPFNIDLSFSGSSSYTDNQRAVFAQAENYWESVISGYQPGIEINSLAITIDSFDGEESGSLGYGGPTSLDYQAGYVLATQGYLSLDTLDVSRLYGDGRLYDLIVHELAHVMGFGTLWGSNLMSINGAWLGNSLYVKGSYQYTGAAALAAYQANYNRLATYVPVENTGTPGDGTIDAHWEEDIFGRELMTGWMNESNFIGAVTLGSFVDIGYVLTPVPVPGALLLFGAGLIGLIGIKRRQV